MRLQAINKFLAFGTFFAFVLHTEVTFSAEKHIALYGTAKYPATFSAFEYVNPNAPKGGKMTMPEYGGFDNFNPFIFKGRASSTVASLIWDSLGVTPVDDISASYPLIAKEFDVTADYVDFILDERALFADGTPVTADDVLFSFNILLEKGAPVYKVYYADVEKAEKRGLHHVRFHFKKGLQNRELPLLLSQLKIFSKKDWENRAFDKPSLQIPLGNGPYRIKSFQPEKYIVLERNPNYWGKDLPSRKGFFNFDEIRIEYYQDTTVTLQALFAGNIDIREEYIAKIWATGYNNDVVTSGKVIKKAFEHNNPATLQYFAFNLRKPEFQDKRVRQAIDLAFNFDWANEKLFYNGYKRLHSHFTNTPMEATGLPEGLEKQILSRYTDRLDPQIFTKPYALVQSATPDEVRQNLKQAVHLLYEAGYGFQNGRMVHLQTGKPLSFEILENSANGKSFDRVMLPFIQNLKKIGIQARFRQAEVNIFKNRLDNFDFDMTILSISGSAMPGTELRELYGSNSADTNGSYNISGIKNEVVDLLIEQIIQTKEKPVYEAYVKALDRVLLSEHYVIFQWYSPAVRVGYQNKFSYPKTSVKTGFEPFTWWSKEAQN